ncbi:AAA family ATPase [Pararobbsia alpina]|uniref:AAA family ATPase n=1 Tax=Pararobbsia alpina TaxID=621374 RepID=UPI0039A61396
MTVVILIGASGAGKTTIAQEIERRHGNEFDVFYFDRIGVPSTEEMLATHGSGEAWQRAKTFEWLHRIATLPNPTRPILFEGQTRLSYLAEAAASAGGLRYVPVLVDCDDQTRIDRLSSARNQPDLANEHMMNWARYLRNEAHKDGCRILDTSSMSLDDWVTYVVNLMRA